MIIPEWLKDLFKPKKREPEVAYPPSLPLKALMFLTEQEKRRLAKREHPSAGERPDPKPRRAKK